MIGSSFEGAMDLKSVFDAWATDVKELFHSPGLGYYIPAYQRPYDWDNDHIDRLFEDLSHGVNELLTSENAISFLGTVITIDDNQNTTIDESVKNELPNKVRTVVDGQQRMTTFLVLIVALHNEISVRRAALPGKIEEGDPGSESQEEGDPESESEQDKWLDGEAEKTLVDLCNMYEEDQQMGEARYYPRMTRAYDDRWSRKSKVAQYKSPIAEFLHKYGEHRREETEREETERYVHCGDESIGGRFNHLTELLNSYVVSSKGDEDYPFPATGELAASQNVVKHLFRDFPAEVASRLGEEAKNGHEESDFAKLYRLVVFARFVMWRAAVTLVEVLVEDYAFDMFEALNTTGEPLTAFETFKPRVITTEGHSAYKTSSSRDEMEKVEAYLERFEKAEERQKGTKDLLTAFALAEAGAKLGRDLRSQRRWLLSSYDNIKDAQKRKDFVVHLSKTAQLTDRVWDPISGSPNFGPIGDLSGEARLSLAVLRDAKHHVVLGPLTRFYASAVSAHDRGTGKATKAKKAAKGELEAALKAMAGFFALWRGAYGSTNNIDRIYRTLMSSGASDVGVGPFARSHNVGNTDVLSSEALKNYMCLALKERGLDTKDGWVSRASETPVYSHSQPLARFLLLAATHDTVPDDEKPGMVKEARDSVLKLLDYDSWTSEAALSVEHVAPRTASDEWEGKLYNLVETIDRLGNLLLLPKAVNSSISNQSWKVKRACYRVLSATTPEELETAKAEAAEHEVELPPMIQDDEAKQYLAVAAGVAKCERDWDLAMVEERSKCLAGLAWDRLAPWVGLPAAESSADSEGGGK